MPSPKRGPSLQKALELAFKNEKGTIEYDVGGLMRKGIYQKMPELNWWMVMVKKEGDISLGNPKLEFSMDKFCQELQGTLQRIDKVMSLKINQNKQESYTEQDIRKLIGSIYREEQSLIDLCFYDRKGILRYIDPSEYKNLEGLDMNSREHVALISAEPRALLSKGISAVEGFLGVELCQPLYTSKDEFVGNISAFFRPDLMIAQMLKQLALPKEYDFWVVQSDGLVLYGPVAMEIGKALFSDPFYAQRENLLNLGKVIIEQPSGTKDFIFDEGSEKEKPIKKAHWNTVKLYDTEWRVILVSLPYSE